MAKNQRQNQINTRIDRQYDQSNTDYDKFKNDVDTRRGVADKRSDALFNESTEGMRGMIPRFRGIGSDARATGSANAARFNKYGDEVAGWARNSISDTDKARMRGLGVFDEFAKTGGWDEGAKKDYMGSIASQMPAFYGGLRDELTRSNTAGFGGAGFNAQTAKLAREASRGGSQALREGRLGLVDSINSGRKWGAEGASSSEAALQGQLSQNYLGGMGLAGNYYGQGADSEFRGLGLDLDASRSEGDVYGRLADMGNAEANRGVSLLGMGGDSLRDKYGVQNQLMNTDMTNNPRQKPWWQYAIDVGVPLASAWLTGGASAGLPGRGGGASSSGVPGNTGISGGLPARLPSRKIYT